MSAPGTDSYVEQGNTQSEYVQQDSAPGAPESIMSNAPMEQSNESHPLADTTVYPPKDNQSFENSPVNNNYSNHISEQTLDYEIAKRNKEARKSQSISRNISELFMGLDFIKTQLFHDPFFTKKNIYSGVLFVGFIIAIIVLIAVIIICVVGHKNNYKYNTNKYGMQRTYTQYVIWKPFHTNSNDSKIIQSGTSRWQVVTFPEPNAGECIIAYSATCQGNIDEFTNTGQKESDLGYITYPLPYVSNCSAVSPNSCVVTVSNPNPSNGGLDTYPYGLYVTATYTILMAINGDGTQYANNITLNQTYSAYQYKILVRASSGANTTYQPEESSIAFFAPSNYIPPKS